MGGAEEEQVQLRMVMSSSIFWNSEIFKVMNGSKFEASLNIFLKNGG